MTEPELIKSRKPSPETKSWHEYILKAEQETPNRLEDAAKFLATIIGISATVMLAAGKAFSDPPQLDLLTKITLALWLLALIAAFLVMFPWRYRYHRESAQSIKAMHRRLVRVKDGLLIASFLGYFAGLLLASLMVFS